MSAQPIESDTPGVALTEQMPLFAALDQLGSELSRSDRARATLAVGMMTTRFGLPEGDFTIVRVDGAPGPSIAAVYAANIGIYEGGWNKIQNPQKTDLYTIMVGDEAYDTRLGMTRAVYTAMYAQAVKEHRRVIPDSKEAARQARRSELTTWLTGEQPTRFFAPQADVDSHRGPRFSEAMRHFPERSIRFRPAVILPITDVQVASNRPENPAR